MSDVLDRLLEEVREAEPFDEAFVQRVMHDVRADEQRRIGRRGLRRPVVMGFAAFVVATGGAVAAFVGSSAPERPSEATQPRASAVVTATDEPRDDTSPDSSSTSDTVRALEDRKDKTEPAAGSGAVSDHTSFVVDRKTGLRLETDTYTSEFAVSKPQRVTVTLSNTGKYPITISGPKGCTMQVVAVEAGDDSSGLDPAAYGGRMEWVCAGSDEDPSVQASQERFVLQPGQRVTSDASITLPRRGGWSVLGTCRCSYTQVKPTPMPKDGDPIGNLTQRSLASPLLPGSSDGRNLATPPISVRAK